MKRHPKKRRIWSAPKERCPRQNKAMYPTEEEALHDAAQMILNGVAFGRAYFHRDCGAWHVTSQPVRLKQC